MDACLNLKLPWCLGSLYRLDRCQSITAIAIFNTSGSKFQIRECLVGEFEDSTEVSPEINTDKQQKQ